MDRPDTSEGDVNRSPARNAWQSAHLGEAAQALLARDSAAFLHQSLSTPCLNVLGHCEGIYLEDFDGRRVMDFHGNSVHQVGYANPRVILAVKQQLDELSFCPRRYTNEPAVKLAERLARLAPEPLGKVLLAPSGTVAIGIAMKIARLATGRHKTLSMWGSFHGASLDAASVGGEALFRDGLGPLLPGAEHVDPPARSRCAYGCGGDCHLRCAEAVEEVLGNGDIGAVIAEPVRCTTVSIPPDGYWQRVRQACDRHGTLLVFDEIPTCLGRCGAMFVCQRLGVVPDILVIGKGLGGAIMPMAAVITRRDLDIAGDRAIGHYTHEKSPVGCAAALATLDSLQHDGLLARAAELGARALCGLNSLRQRHPIIHSVRGLGLLLAAELGPDDDMPRDRSCEAAERVMYEALHRGLSFKVSDGNVLTLTPPLTITPDQLDAALAILDASLAAVC